MYRLLKLNESSNLNEARKYRTLQLGDIYQNANGTKVQIINVDKEHLVDGEPQVTYKFLDTNDSKCYKMSNVNNFLEQNNYKLTESALNEDEKDDKEEVEDTIENIENQEEVEDTIDSEEDQDENPVEEEFELDKQLDELREILPDLDLRLYQVTNKEDLKDTFYFIGKVAEDSNDVLMLVDNKPEEINNDTIEDTEKLEDTPVEEAIDGTSAQIEQAKEESKEKGLYSEAEEEIEPLEDRFDYVDIPKRFEDFKTLAPRYGEELTPDHQALVDYLMNCLIEVDPEAAEEIQKEKPEDALLPIEDINGEEEIVDED